MSTLQNKVVAVFAANGAIASAVAKSFAQHGAKLYVSGRNLKEVKKLADEIKKAGGQAEAHQVDALNESQIDAYLKKVSDDNGKLNIVFNGIGVRANDVSMGLPTAITSLEHFLEPLKTIVGSQFLTSKVAANYMIATKSEGTILTLTSSLSRLKLPFMAGISSASTAIEGLTRVLAAEFGNFGIKVIGINSTALFESRSIQESNANLAKTMGIPSEALKGMQTGAHLLPGKRTPTLKEVGDVAAFLVSDAGAALNSHIIDVDFGSMMVI